MEFIRENFELMMIIGVGILAVLMVIVIGYNKYLVSYYMTKKFHIDANYEIDAYSSQRRMAIKIYNNNINDVRVAAFGFIYKHHNIDFYHKYIDLNGLPKNHKLVISSRDYITIYIAVDDIKAIIYEINKGRYKVGLLQTYVTDSLGMTSLIKTKKIRKLVSQDLRSDFLQEKQKKSEIRKQLKEDKKILKVKQKKENKLKFIEKMNRFKMSWIKFLGRFKRKSKSKD